MTRLEELQYDQPVKEADQLFVSGFRKFTFVTVEPGNPVTYPEFLCECGHSKDSHTVISETTGLQSTIVLRCPDGELTVY